MVRVRRDVLQVVTRESCLKKIDSLDTHGHGPGWQILAGDFC